MKRLLTTVLALAALISMLGQGIVRGKVVDDTGLPCIGATIQRVDDMSIGTLTDFDGLFSIEVPSNVMTELLIKYLGFNDFKVAVNPGEGKVQTLELAMVSNAVLIDQAVVITARANKANDGYMERIKQNSATSIDYISNATLRKIGDGDMGAAVKRVSGVSTVGSFVSVRGLADRYITTSINGSRIPTLDPFTNNIRLDLFPSGLIDNLIITKTGAAELPGDWSGAYLSIETKDYPDELDIRVNTSFGYNSQSTFNNIIGAQQGDTEWLGYDNGFKDVPDVVAAYGDILPRVYTFADNTGDQLYPIFQNLGLQSFMDEYGILPTSSQLGPQQSLFNFLMVELGLLAPAQIYDLQATSEALALFNAEGGPRQSAINVLNGRIGEIGSAFNNSALYASNFEAPLDFSQSFSIGNQFELFGQPFGYVAGFKYTKTTRYDPASLRADAFANLARDYETVDGIPFKEQVYEVFNTRQASQSNNGWSALAKASYKFNKNNSVSLLFMPNMNGNSEARVGRLLALDDTRTVRLKNEQFYEERKQFIYQARTEHFIQGPDIKVQLDASYTDGQSNTLDFMDWEAEYNQIRLSDLDLDGDLPAQLENETLEFAAGIPRPTRSYRYLDEDILDARLNLEIPVFRSLKRNSFLKVGGAYRQQDRKYTQRFYLVDGVFGQPFLYNDIDAFFSNDRFNVVNGVVDLNYLGFDNTLFNNIGISKIWAGYVSLDHRLTERLRSTIGVRFERTDMLFDISKFYDAGLPADSPERGLRRPSTINEDNFLPSIGLIYKLKDEPDDLINIRASFFQSLARPALREISLINLYEYTLQTFVAGNTDLQMTTVNNYDLRLERYFGTKGNISVSVFYKDFDKHIELVNLGDRFSWTNTDRSNAKGVELEGSYGLPMNMEVIGNLTLIDSETRFKNQAGETIARSMFGQAPYIVNTTLSYTADSLRLQVAISYNRQGRKLALVNNSRINISGQPDVFEMPMDLIDIQINKRFGKHFGIGFNVNNLLNASRQRVYDFDNYDNVFFDSFTWGTTYKVNFSYQL